VTMDDNEVASLPLRCTSATTKAGPELVLALRSEIRAHGSKIGLVHDVNFFMLDDEPQVQFHGACSDERYEFGLGAVPSGDTKDEWKCIKVCLHESRVQTC